MSGFRVFVANHRHNFSQLLLRHCSEIYNVMSRHISECNYNIYFKLVASYIVFYFTEIPFFTMC